VIDIISAIKNYAKSIKTQQFPLHPMLNLIRLNRGSFIRSRHPFAQTGRRAFIEKCLWFRLQIKDRPRGSARLDICRLS